MFLGFNLWNLDYCEIQVKNKVNLKNSTMELQ